MSSLFIKVIDPVYQGDSPIIDTGRHRPLHGRLELLIILKRCREHRVERVVHDPAHHDYTLTIRFNSQHGRHKIGGHIAAARLQHGLHARFA